MNELVSLSYNSIWFLPFLALLFLVYFSLGRKGSIKKAIILIANLVFYSSNGIGATAVITGTGVIVYFISGKMGSVYEQFECQKADLSPKEQVQCLAEYKKTTKKYLFLGMALILSVWIFVKIGKLLGLPTVGTFFGVLTGSGILVPLGISYYTLSSVGYLLDVYWRKVKPERNFLSLFAVMTYFPHIVQGPISKYGKLLEQFQSLPGFDYKRFCFGMQLMVWGYFKKLVIADRLNLFTSAVFDAPQDYAGMEILLAVLLCVVQLYADFSGCMDIVSGASEILGIDLERNFRQPFFAESAQEFWTRWHITLGAWTKEYIYLPIAMNPKFLKKIKGIKKKGALRTAAFLKAFCPLVAVWLFTGLWHGTGADYLVWGLYWCALMTVSNETKVYRERLKEKMSAVLPQQYFRMKNYICVFLFFAIGRMFTVAGSLEGCYLLWKRLFAESRPWVLFDGSLYSHGLEQKSFYVAFIGIALLIIVDRIHEKGGRIREWMAAQPLPIRWGIYYAAVFSILIFGIYGLDYNASDFIYGAF